MPILTVIKNIKVIKELAHHVNNLVQRTKGEEPEVVELSTELKAWACLVTLVVVGWALGINVLTILYIVVSMLDVIVVAVALLTMYLNFRSEA